MTPVNPWFFPKRKKLSEDGPGDVKRQSETSEFFNGLFKSSKNKNLEHVQNSLSYTTP